MCNLPPLPSATVVSLLLIVMAHSVSPLNADERSEFFESRIRPLLLQKCAECHSGETPEGDLRIDKGDAIRKGGIHGPAINEGKPDTSLLVERLLTTDEKLQMPPQERLADAEISDLKRWIADGAYWPESETEWASENDRAAHWAFQPVRDVATPDVPDPSWCQSPIDHFIAARHVEAGVHPVPAAEKRTLIRRATLDLTGLPPRIEDVNAFVSDESPDAFAKVVDRLLSDSAYGERWGRYWLDQARYADTSGDGTDTPIPEARYYRNYVIQALNEDLPYNEFLIEQIAGDLLAAQDPGHPRSNDRIIATGYVALSRRFGNSAFASMNLIIDDTVDTIGKSVLGLTLGCARCHHHKFDPVTLNDYYGIYGYFQNTQYPHAGTEHQKEREHFVSMQKTATWRSDYDSLEAWAVSDLKKQKGDANILIGGDENQKGEKVPRSYLSVLTSELPRIPSDSSGRLQFAQWLTRDDNPLTTRVIVNRVWQYHFGRGIVESSSNFGLQGSKPTHPELLDWLATDFVKHGWSLKHLHRRIMLSATYQLSSTVDAENLKQDEANQTWWRFDRRRMDAETIRDSLLAVSMKLQVGDGGRHPFKATKDLKYSQGRPFNEIFDHHYRSVYLMSPRLNKHPFMALFDGPDPNKTTENRRESTVALQALYVMNGSFMTETSQAFADRLMTFASNSDLRLEHAWQVALGRNPQDSELSSAREYIADYTLAMTQSGKSAEDAERLAWTSFSRALLSSNEFLYVD